MAVHQRRGSITATCGSRNNTSPTLFQRLRFAAMADRLDAIRELKAVCKRLLPTTVYKSGLDSNAALRRQRIVACVIWVLSDTAPLSEAYLLARGCTATETSAADSSPDGILLLLMGWLVAEFECIFAAVTDMENPYRVEADCFLVRSLTAMVVHVHSQKGVVVSTAETIFHYLRFWSFRPVAAALQPVLRKLTYHRNVRRKFGQLLRREWMLDYGSHRIAAELSDDETTQRVLRNETPRVAFARPRLCIRHDVDWCAL